MLGRRPVRACGGLCLRPIFAVVTIAALRRRGRPAWTVRVVRAQGLAAPGVDLPALDAPISTAVPRRGRALRGVERITVGAIGIPSISSGISPRRAARARASCALRQLLRSAVSVSSAGRSVSEPFSSVGAFLVGIAGVLLVGLIRAAGRHTTQDLLLLAGFLTGPFVAHARWRRHARCGGRCNSPAVRRAARGRRAPLRAHRRQRRVAIGGRARLRHPARAGLVSTRLPARTRRRVSARAPRVPLAVAGLAGTPAAPRSRSPHGSSSRA